MTDEPAQLRPIDATSPAAVDASAAPWDGVTRPRSRTGTRFLKDVVVDLGLADRERVERASDEARQQGTTLEAALLAGGVVTQEALSRAVAERHGLDHVDLGVFRVDMSAANLITSAQAKRYEAVPVAQVGENAVILAMADPQNVLAIDEIAMLTGHEIRPAVASREDIQALVSRLTRLDDVVQSAAFDLGQHPVINIRSDKPVLMGREELRNVTLDRAA